MNDLARRATVAAAGWASGARVEEPTRLPGGASSITYVARVRGGPPSDERIVLKVAPPGLAPVRNRDVLRQARVLRALADAPPVRVPRVLFEDPGAPPDVPPFFAMRYVDGDSFEPNMDEGEPPPPPIVESRARQAARMLGALHAVRPDAIGFADEPEVSLTEEVERWARLFSTIEPPAAHTDECTKLLRRTIPDGVATVVVHGDFRLGNMLSNGGDVAAVIDWEIWARGDPRVDLGWFLLSADPELHPSARRDAPGMPRPPALLDEYAAARGVEVDLDTMRWFLALTCFKLAAITAQIVKNQRRAGDPHGIVAYAEPQVPVGLGRAHAILVELARAR